MVDPTLLIMVVVALLTLETDITCGNDCAKVNYPVLKVCEMGTSNTGYRVGLDFSLVQNSTSSDCWCYIQQHNQGSIYISTVENPGTAGCGIIIYITQQGQPEQTFGCGGGSYTPDSSKPGDVTNIHSKRLVQPDYNIKYCLRAFDSAYSQISVTCCAAGKTDCYTPITTATEAPTTKPKTEAHTTKPITEAPTTKPITEALTTKTITDAPTTKPITEAPTTKTATEAPTTMDTEGNDTEPPPKSSPTIKVVVAVPLIVGVIIVCTVIVIVVLYRSRRRSNEEQTYDRHATATAHDEHQYEDLVI